MSFFSFLRDAFDADTEEDQKKRLARGGRRRYDDDERENQKNKAPASNPLEQIRNLLVGAGRGVARVPETGARSFIEGVQDVLDYIPGAPPREEDKMVGGAGTDSDEVKDPLRRLLYGDERIETYQTRQRGIEKTIGESRFRDKAKPFSFLAIGATAASDILPTPSKGGDKLVKGLVKEVSEDGVKKLLGKEVAPEVAERIAPALAKATTADEVKEILSRETGEKIAKAGADDVIEPVVTKPGERQRGLLKTTQAENLPEATRVGSRAVEPQTYKQLNIDETLEQARKQVSTGFDDARRAVNEALDSGQQVTPEISALSRALVEKAGSQGQDEVVQEIMAKLAPQATISGQANVVWRGLAQVYDPEGMVKFAQKVIDDANKHAGFLTKTVRKVTGQSEFSLDDATKNLIRERMTVARSLPDGDEKDAIMKEVMDAINDRVPPGASELFDAYRYQNLLSNPRTQARNSISNLFNTMVTRPVTLATRASTDWFGATLFGKERQAYLKEVPEYYRGLFNSTGDAIEAFKGAWKSVPDYGQPDLKTIRALKSGKTPKFLTAVPRFMEAQDRFFSTLISSGEYAARKAAGASDEAAKSAADKVAEYSLFRAALDPTNKSGQGELLSKIDQFSDSVTKFGQKHKAFRWFVPFIRTPMNVSKQLIEFSPAGLATLKGSDQQAEQLSKAMIGTTIMTLGAKAALDGNTTWDVPKDPKQRELFYASGKRPFSIKIGDQWVPMIYFGPFSFALGLPAAIKDANDEAPLDASGMDKLVASLTNVSKQFSQQTYVQGVANFVDVLSGEGDANLASSLGFTAGQAIPLQGLQRYVASIVDPIYRKKPGFLESIKADTPFLSRDLEPYTDITGEPSRRNLTDYIGPYTIGESQLTPGAEERVAVEESFYKTLRKISPERDDYNDRVNDAIKVGDMDKAREIANEFNAKLKTGFAKWVEEHPDYVNDETLASLYNRQRIVLNRSGVAQRRYSLLKQKREEERYARL